MKKNLAVLFLSLGFFSLVACEYNAPLSSEHNIAIDQAILGAWVIKTTESQGGKTGIRINQFSGTEYAVHYYEGNSDFYFRAYPINIAGVDAVQLELIGSDEGAIDRDENDRYHVVSYKMVDGQLEIRTLNTDLVDDELPDSESLQKAFIEHKNNPELFNDPGLFERVKI